MHRVAIGQIKMLATALARHTGQEEEEATRHLFQRLSLGLMRGNTALLVSRGPDGECLQVPALSNLVLNIFS